MQSQFRIDLQISPIIDCYYGNFVYQMHSETNYNSE